MHVVLLDVPDELRGALRAALSRRHRVTVPAVDVLDPELTLPGSDVVIQGYPTSPDRIERSTLGTWNVLTSNSAPHYVQLSSMRNFRAYHSGWHVDETWQPLPSSDLDDLAFHLAELTSREVSRSAGPKVDVLRLDRVICADRFITGPVESDWLHITDAITAITRAVEGGEPPRPGPGWQPWHIVRGGGRFPLRRAKTAPLLFTPAYPHPAEAPAQHPPRHAFEAQPLIELPTPERITILGAAGPLGAAAAEHLRHDHVIRLSDVRPLAELAARDPQSPGAPRGQRLGRPHEELTTDVTDAAAVLAAAKGSNCLVNCSVVRTDPGGAFRVNVLGALHTMNAAVREGIPRVVHTGPALVLTRHPLGYLDDRNVLESAPARAGADLYFLTKLLGQEICRIFAEEYGIASPSLLFCGFVAPDRPRPSPPHPFSVSWSDAGRAVAAAVRVRNLPTPSPVVHVLAQSPHGRYRADTAREVLGWVAEDSLERFWYRHRQPDQPRG